MTSKKVEATRKLLEIQGDDPETINATLELISINDKVEKMNEIRSWVAVTTGILALAVSVLVAILK